MATQHMNVDEEVAQLAKEIVRLGQRQPDGSVNVTFGAPEHDLCFICLRCILFWFYVPQFSYGSFTLLRSLHCPPKWLLMITPGVLFKDDRCANVFEALVGTLRAAKKRKQIKYGTKATLSVPDSLVTDGELLLQGVHDKVVVTLLPEFAK